MAKTNTTKANKTAIEAAQEVIQKQNQKDVNDCVAALQALQIEENKVLEKYGCVKNIVGQFVNNQIVTEFKVSKK